MPVTITLVVITAVFAAIIAGAVLLVVKLVKRKS
jgi:hypothetical protein